MTALAMLVAGAAVGLGLWLVAMSVTGVRVLPSTTRLVPGEIPERFAPAWIATAAATGVALLMLTRWPVAALACSVAVLAGPAVVGSQRHTRDGIAVAEAVAGWADMIRDTMAGAAGLEETLITTAYVAPNAIRPDLTVFARRLRHEPLDRALDHLADELNHPSADLVVASLRAAARLEAADLGGLLARLAEAIRGDVRMRVRVEVGRTRIRTSARIAIATTAATVAFLFLFARHLLEPYDTWAGQGWLVVVAAVFISAGMLLRYYGTFDTPQRFRLRHATRELVP